MTFHVNSSSCCDWYFMLSRTALIVASEEGHANVVEYLVENASADLEAKDSDSR